MGFSTRVGSALAKLGPHAAIHVMPASAVLFDQLAKGRTDVNSPAELVAKVLTRRDEQLAANEPEEVSNGAD